jgi:hypothetical protein
MTATKIQALETGGHKDIVMFGNERIWAEPYFDGNLIHPGFWKEISLV